MTLLDLMRSDIEVWGDLWVPSRRRSHGYGALTTLWLIWSFLGLRAALIYRLSHGMQRRGVKALPQILSRFNVELHGLDIPSSVPIGPRLYIPHPIGTVVMAGQIGSDLTLVSNVTVGMRQLKGSDFPTIGDHVYLGAGARVLGRVRIGNGVQVGANAVVLSDVPDGAVAVGVPARIRLRTDSTGYEP